MNFRFDFDEGTGCYYHNGVEIITFNDNYPAGHQSGVSLIMNDRRMAAGGDLRFEQTPGQWQPVPKKGDRVIDKEKESVCVHMHYPDTNGHLRGFNPLIYPDVELDYTVEITPIDGGVTIRVATAQPIPTCLAGKACFSMEIVPIHVFGKSWLMDDQSGIFPRQPNGPTKAQPANYDVAGVYKNTDGQADTERLVRYRRGYSPMVADDIIGTPYASGHCFTATPEDPLHSFTVTSDTTLHLYDGRMNHNNGWFVLSSELPTETTGELLTWTLTPSLSPDWEYPAVIQVSQVGYHNDSTKIAVIETDRKAAPLPLQIYRITARGPELYQTITPVSFGDFLRYHYYQADFSSVCETGLYQLRYGHSQTHVFRIAEDVFDRGVWQPVLEYFLPVQMCHMRVSEKYRVWHGHCHKDDARMAPTNYNHFDGYYQGPDTLTSYQPGDVVPGLDAGGWHDAGDYDLRIESQAGEVYNLSLAQEEFHIFYDSSTIDQENHTVEIHQPDGRNDLQQQIEHGLLTILGGYRSLGRLYRGIICNDIRQYVLLGDASTMTDGISGGEDDRWVFTENNPHKELSIAAQLAAASRAMVGFNDAFAEEALAVAKELYDITVADGAQVPKIHAAIELFITTGDATYRRYILDHVETIEEYFEQIGWVAVRILDTLQNEAYTARIRAAALCLREKQVEECAKTPYGVPYRPGAWGSGWGIQGFGAHYYYFHKALPDIFPAEPMIRALDFVLGCHPGTNTASFASGVGAKSNTTAYGANRADYSYIPGGVSSGTELIAPDFPELLEFPFLWQQGEYVLGGGSSNYMFLVLAVRQLFS